MKMLRVAVVGAFVVAERVTRGAATHGPGRDRRSVVLHQARDCEIDRRRSRGLREGVRGQGPQALAILTDGDGLLKITGDFAADKYTKLTPFIGRQVEVSGTPDRIPRLLARHQSDEARASRKGIDAQTLES